MLKYMKIQDFVPLALAIVVGVFLLVPGAAADPYMNAKTGACHLPLDMYYQGDEWHYHPSEEEGIDMPVWKGRATGECLEVAEKSKPGLIADLALPALPYTLKLNGNKTGFLCRMVDSNGTVYYTARWNSLFKVETNGAKLKITKALFCRQGIAKK